jgi:hypothetical protein
LLDDDDEIRWRFGFADWGPTTDNVTSHIFHAGEGCAITLEFCRATHHDPAELGAVLVAELPEGELVQMLTQALALLESGAE